MLNAAPGPALVLSHGNAESACDLLGGLSKLLPLDISEDMCMYATTPHHMCVNISVHTYHPLTCGSMSTLC